MSLWVDRCALIGDLSHISIVVVSCVLDMLDPSVWESYGVRARHNITITGLSSVEISFGVVIGNSVLVGVGFILASWFMVGFWGISWSCMDCMMDWSSVNNWGSMDNWSSMYSVVHRDMRNMNWGSMDSVVNWGMVGNRVNKRCMMHCRMSYSVTKVGSMNTMVGNMG